MNSITKLSRSAVEQYLKCSRCAWHQYRNKIRFSSFPLTLNLALDILCKNDFDYYRDIQKPHPLFIEKGIDAVPYNHPQIDNWRNNFKGAYYTNEQEGYKFGGAVDDIWKHKSGELIISDVKATAKNIFDWEDTYSKYDYAKGYKRQLEMYQFVFRKLGFDVSNKGYLLYFNGKKNEKSFNNQLNFETHLIELECSDHWVEETIIAAKNCFNSEEIPDSNSDCEMCNYIKKRWSVCQKDVGEFIDKCNQNSLRKKGWGK